MAQRLEFLRVNNFLHSCRLIVELGSHFLSLTLLFV